MPEPVDSMDMDGGRDDTRANVPATEAAPLADPTVAGASAGRRRGRALPTAGLRDGAGRPALPEERIARLDRLAGRFLFRAVLAALLAVSVFRPILFPEQGLEPILGPEAADYAQIGRNLARGQSFRTDAVVPLTIGMGWPVQATPELSKPPLPSVLLGLAFRGAGPSDSTVLAVQYASLCFCLAMLYWAGARAFGAATGLLATALIALNPSAVAVAGRYGNVGICAALVSCVLVVLTYVARQGVPDVQRPRSSGAAGRQMLGFLLAGLLFGLAYLSEYVLLMVLVPLLAQVYTLAPPERRWRATGLTLVGFLVLALPWWVRCWVLFQSPVISLDRYVAMLFTNAYPGTTVLRSVGAPGNPYLFLLTHPSAAFANLLRCGAGLSGLPAVISPMVIVGGGLLYLTPLKSASDACWRRLLLGGTVAVLLVTAFTIQFTVVNFMPLLPLAALAAAVAFVRLIRSFGGGRAVIVSGVLAVLLMVPAWARPEANVSAEARLTIFNLQWMSHNARRDVVVISDTPQLVAWYMDRPSVWLPATQRDLQAVVSAAKAPVVLFLSRGLAQWPSADGAQYYQELLTAREAPPGFTDVPLPVPGGRLLIPRSADAPEESDRNATDSGG